MSQSAPKSLSYVRKEMLAPKEAPLSQVGANRWIRENLFSGPVSTVLTLLSLFVIWQILASLGPWLMNTVWNAGSLSQCRQILDGAGGAVSP